MDASEVVEEPPRPFHVVTDRAWLAQSFAHLGAVQDYGVDIDPATASDTIWWAPGGWVARAYKSGIHLPLLSCGPHWMKQIPWEYPRRRIKVCQLKDAPATMARWYGNELDHPNRLFLKLAEAKVDNFPAQVFLFKPGYLGRTLAQFHLPEGTLLQMSDEVHFVLEARLFVAHSKITTGCFYRVFDTLWDDEDFRVPATISGEFDTLVRFAEQLLADRDVATPPGFVLDVGILEDGMPAVVEVNAAWSSGPYTCEPEGVFAAVAAAHDFVGDYPQWGWNPNPALYPKVRELPRCSEPTIHRF